MNTLRRVVLSMGACIAVLTTTSCSADKPDNSNRSELPAFTSQTPAGFDMWEQINSGEMLPEMMPVAKNFGLDAINVPTGYYYDHGAVGVATLEKYCVLIFEDATMEQPLVTVSLLSRYNESYTMVMPGLPPDSVAKALDKYRPVCTGDADFPTENVGPTTPDQAA